MRPIRTRVRRSSSPKRAACRWSCCHSLSVVRTGPRRSRHFSTTRLRGSWRAWRSLLLGNHLDILLPALLTGLLVLATHVPLGRLVLDRGIVFIDLAVAQAAGLGVVTADLLGWEPEGWGVQASAALAALLVAGFL